MVTICQEDSEAAFTQSNMFGRRVKGPLNYPNVDSLSSFVLVLARLELVMWDVYSLYLLHMQK